MNPQDFQIRGTFPMSGKAEKKLHRLCIGTGGVVLVVGVLAILSTEEIFSLVALCYTPILGLSLPFFYYAFYRNGEHMEISDDSVSIKRKDKTVWSKAWQVIDEIRVERIDSSHCLVAIINGRKKRLPVSESLHQELTKRSNQPAQVNPCNPPENPRTT